MFRHKKIKQDILPKEYKGRIGKRIGLGVSGSVYELKGEDGADLLINKRKWVVKIPLDLKEEKITAQYRQTFSKDDYLFTEKVEGKPIYHFRFGFLQGLKVASLIAHGLNVYHHCKPTRDATIHNDLHPGIY